MLAVSLLLRQKCVSSLAVDTMNLHYEKNIIIDSFEHYTDITGISQDFEACCAFYYGLRHGCTIRINNIPDTYVILYDQKEPNRRRLNWSLAHEIGHIYMEHESDETREEIETNFFASQLLVPDAVLMALISSGIRITEPLLRDRFFLSQEAARKKLQYLRKCGSPEMVNRDILKVFEMPLKKEFSLQGVPQGCLHHIQG